MINLCDYYCCIMPYRPEQVHIASTGDPTQMVINFVTGEEINPTVQFGLTNCQPSYGPPGDVFIYDPQTCNFTYTVVGTSSTIKTASWQGYLHTVLLSDLTPSTTYWYRVGDPFWDWSTHNFNFTTAPVAPLPANSVTRVVAFGGSLFNYFFYYFYYNLLGSLKYIIIIIIIFNLIIIIFMMRSIEHIFGNDQWAI